MSDTQTILKPEILKASPAKDYENLRKQFFALKKLCESKIHQCQIYSKKLAEYDRESVIARNEALNSEREMNAQLTEQLAKANERIAELESYNVKLANESHEYQQRCAELDEIADTAFKYNHSSAQCLRAWNKFQQLRKEQSDDC